MLLQVTSFDKAIFGGDWIRLSWRMHLFAVGDWRLFEYIIDIVADQIIVMITSGSWIYSSAVVL